LDALVLDLDTTLGICFDWCRSRTAVRANLSTTNWLAFGAALANCTGLFPFPDTNAPLFPIRCYRALSP